MRCPAFVLLVCTLTACRRTQPARNAFELPDAIAGLAASPRDLGAGYVRRTYTAGPRHITVTLARHPMDSAAYERWVSMSTAGFPQADLGLSAAAANGFYQCDSGAPERCDLLIQLRSGVHIEIRGGGTSTRSDVNTIRKELPLAALADDGAVGHSAAAR